MDGSTLGIIAGRLRAVYVDRIIIGDKTIYLQPGAACTHAIGMDVEVTYTERDGRAEASSIVPLETFR